MTNTDMPLNIPGPTVILLFIIIIIQSYSSTIDDKLIMATSMVK